MAGTGGKRVGAGRKKGSVNKATANVKALAQKHAPEAIKKLNELKTGKDVPAATQRAAANDILDRAYGKPTQAITDPDGGKLFPEKIEVVFVKAKT